MLERAKRNGWQYARGGSWRTAEKLVGLGLADWHYASTGAILGVTITSEGRKAIA